MRDTIRAGMWAWLRGSFPSDEHPREDYPRAVLGAFLMLAVLVLLGATIVLAWLLLLPPQE